MRAGRLQAALQSLSLAITDVQAAIDELRAEQDPLAAHIFAARRAYRNTSDVKSGKRHDLATRLSWDKACDLGFRGSLDEWQRLMGAVAKR